MFFAGVLYVLNRFAKSKANIYFKVFAVLLFAFYMARIFAEDYIDQFWGLENNLFSPVATAFLVLLKWLTLVSIGSAVVGCFFNIKTINNIIAFLGNFVLLFNIIFASSIFKMFDGANWSLSGYRAIEYILEMGIFGAITINYLITKIKTKDWQDLTGQIKYFFIVLPCLFLAMMPLSTLQLLFGHSGRTIEDFNLMHRLVMYGIVIVTVVLFLAFRKKDKQIRDFALTFMALAAFFAFFYNHNYKDLSYTNLPLHLCNTGVIMVLLAFVFRIRGLFYFNYFVNIIGCIVAIVMPDFAPDMFAASGMHFWICHIYVLILPILARLFGMFSRPNFKMMRMAVYIFTIYFVSMMFANAYINSFASVDYFFLYGNKIVDKIGFLGQIKLNYVWLPVVNGVTYKVFWLYDILVYVGFVFLMFMIWLVFEYFYKLEDHYAELLALKKIDSLEIKELRKKMKGRKLSEPVNPEGKDTLKISHFSKVYGLNKFKSVDDFSLEVHGGEVFGFLGHNGAGKSTLIKSIVGIQSITEGSIEVCGYDIKLQPLQAKMHMGYVSDNHSVYENLTGREYINYVADLYLVSKQDRDERIDKYSKMFELTDALDRQIKGYSHGMKQKLVVIAALIHDPKVWVLDEPLTGLDPSSSYQIKECMREHANKGNIVFFSSHVIEVVEKICDRIAIIQKGKLQGVFDVKKLKENGINLEKLYLSFIDNTEGEEHAELLSVQKKAFEVMSGKKTTKVKVSANKKETADKKKTT